MTHVSPASSILYPLAPHNTPTGSPQRVPFFSLENLYPRIEKLCITPTFRKPKKINIDPVYKRKSQRTFSRPPSGKYWWRDTLGRDVAAGGILIIDTYNNQEGVWVISEKSRRGFGEEYTDIGGRYHYDDCDIYATISREFREELYNTDEIPYSIIKELATTESREDKFVYRMVKGKYVCLVVHRKYLNTLKLDNELVQNAKKTIYRENPYISYNLYRTESIEFLPFDRILHLKNKLSFRLNDILFNSPLKFRIT